MRRAVGGDGGRASRGAAVLTAARAGWGGLLVVAAPRLAGSLGQPQDRRAVAVVRVLGLRHLVQAAVVARRRRSIRDGAVVDLVHGLSMLSLAVLDAPRRRAALLDATVAFGFAAAGRAVAQEQPEQPPKRGSRSGAGPDDGTR